MRKKRIIALLAVLLMAAPLWAVFKENNLNQTLSVLLMELKETYANLQLFFGSAEKRIAEQHQKLAQLVDECNELSVMLYSQASENTFDLTFALNEVTRQYEQFKGESNWAKLMRDYQQLLQSLWDAKTDFDTSQAEKNMAVLDDRKVRIVRIEKVELDPKGHQLIAGSRHIIKEF